jgi:23S rRNA pseudouridine1911/1915/1917 synthase|tara:strand:- start:222 stop:1193 length:972 start_codon:yes stop_codon:yes gene_type:complete
MNEFYNLKLTINKQLSSQRLDKVLVSKLEGYSRTQIKTLILNGNVSLDEKEIKDPSYITKENENYFINIILKQETKHSAENIDLNIIFEDEDLIVINKPPNLVMHPAPGNESGTLVNALMHYTNNQLSNLDDNSRPGIVHRLDKDTSGILVVAKNNNVHINLAEQFKEHTISRRYKAIVWGTPDNQSIEGYIERNRKNRKKMSLNNKGFGKYSKTDIKLEKTFGIASLVDCHLHTGRTHQIRLHLTSKNSPIIGDKIYGKSKINQFGKDKNTFNKFMILKNFERQALHAYHLGFDHPTSKKRMDFDIEIPEDFKNLIELLLKY